MAKLIVGLGNPGEQYQNNRHNVGFMFIDYLLHFCVTRYTLHVTPFTNNKYVNSEIATIKIDNDNIILAKPQTFMNESGIAVASCVTRYTLHVTQDLIIVHDDLDIPLGMFKIQKGTGPQLHNGIESIEKHLKTKDFLRVRIGVDARPSNDPTRLQPISDAARYRMVPGETYVLSNFLPDEKNELPIIFSKIFTRIKNEFLII